MSHGHIPFASFPPPTYHTYFLFLTNILVSFVCILVTVGPKMVPGATSQHSMELNEHALIPVR